jgi:hypothetical protein
LVVLLPLVNFTFFPDFESASIFVRFLHARTNQLVLGRLLYSSIRKIAKWKLR